MFKNNIEDEADFCEAYKSQILNQDTEESESSPIVSILIILLLLVMIIALSIFGYNYIMSVKDNAPEAQASVKMISDDELKVTSEVAEPIQATNKTKDNDIKKTVVKSLNELPKSESLDVNDLADKIKIDMSENEEKKRELKPIPSVMDSTESKYIEDLAKLTAEIDKERE